MSICDSGRLITLSAGDDVNLVLIDFDATVDQRSIIVRRARVLEIH
jgi:hypothetical protein